MTEDEEAIMSSLFARPEAQVSYLSGLMDRYGRQPYLMVRVALALANCPAVGIARVTLIKVTLYGDRVEVC